LKKAVIICCVFAHMIAARAQDPVFKWVSAFGSNEFVYSTAIITDANGNLYTLGYFSGKHDFDSGPGVYELTSTGLDDIFIVKTDPGGNFIWARAIGGPGEEVGYSMVRDINGNIFISGAFQLTADFDPGAGSFNRTAVTPTDMFICKLDPSGNFLWAVTIPGLGSQAADFISTDDNGNVFMGGNFTGTVDFDPGPGVSVLNSDEQLGDMFILKLDASGSFIWVKEIEVKIYGYVFDIAVDHTGSVYTTGNFRSIVDFDPGVNNHLITSQGDEDIFILKLDADGNFQWVAQFGGVGVDVGMSIDVDDNGNVYSVGEFEGSVDFDPGAGVFNLNNTGLYEAPYILKLDASGNLIWARQAGGQNTVIHGLAIDKSGDVYITGLFSGTLDLDPSISKDDLVGNKTDMFLAKFSTDGIFEWDQQVTGPDLDYGFELAVDDYGNVFTTGIFHGTADFDSGPNVHQLTSTGQGDVYILKTGICTQTPASSIVETACTEFTLNDRTYTLSGTYNQTIINFAGCDSTITLDLTVTGTANTNIAKSICHGESFEGYSVGGTYTDVFKSSNGCDSMRTLNLSVVDKPSVSLGEDVFLCKGDSISLYPGPFDSYIWQDDSHLDRLLVKEPGMYSVTVQTACGAASDQVIVKAGPCGVFFPSAFTPNNDGVNDIFTTPVRNDFFSSYQLVVYNRWGQKIFESKDPATGWDGKVNGILQTAETFVWACNFIVRANGIKDSRQGTVTLLR
jgi:gliding motility-associated-like protein